MFDVPTNRNVGAVIAAIGLPLYQTFALLYSTPPEATHQNTPLGMDPPEQQESLRLLDVQFKQGDALKDKKDVRFVCRRNGFLTLQVGWTKEFVVLKEDNVLSLVLQDTEPSSHRARQ
jgi:hypothetical protein